MPRFSYQARDGRGDLSGGFVAAATMEEAGRMLRAEGKYIVRLTPASDSSSSSQSLSLEQHSRRVKRSEVIFFAHQMAVMIETGVPLSEALECSVEQAQNEHFRLILRDVASFVQAGGDFSGALRRYPSVFPAVMTSLIKASEVSGTMGVMLDRISGYMAKEQQTVKQIRGAMMYPAFMVVMAVGVTVFLLSFVLPRFAGIYDSKGAVLPPPTRLLLALSNSMVNYWYVWIGVSVLLIAGTLFGITTPRGRRALDWLKLHTPILGFLFTQLYVTRACRTMGTMLSAGVSMLDMVAIVKQVTANTYFEDLWDQVDERLRQGAQLSEPLHASTLIPRPIVQMIYSGEKSGRLAQVMGRIADFTEHEFDTAVKSTTQFIEPLMIGVMGSIIGFVAISLLLPIFSVGKVVAGG